MSRTHFLSSRVSAFSPFSPRRCFNVHTVLSHGKLSIKATSFGYTLSFSRDIKKTSGPSSLLN
jgi:hypothetical protein